MIQENQIDSLKERVRYLEDELDSAREAAVKSERLMMEYLDENKRLNQILNAIRSGMASKGTAKTRRSTRAITTKVESNERRAGDRFLTRGAA